MAAPACGCPCSCCGCTLALMILVALGSVLAFLALAPLLSLAAPY